MKNFIELTTATKMLININHITAIIGDDDCCIVHITNRNPITVHESYEEVKNLINQAR